MAVLTFIACHAHSIVQSLRCLAHIVNLATQALLNAHSRSHAYDPKNPDADLIATVTRAGGAQRDEVGVVRTICVKERSSAKRKEIFQKIQMQDKVNHPARKQPLQLLLDMPVRWSSTYLMLERADHLKDDVDSFVHEIAAAERDRERRQKLMNLQLTDDEWFRICTLLALLGKSEQAQQSFSSDRGPAVHLALPALEALHKAWHSRSLKRDYVDFWEGLEAGVKKIAGYYEKSAESDVYIMAMRTHSHSTSYPIKGSN